MALNGTVPANTKNAFDAIAMASPAAATFPFPAGGSDPYDYTKLHIADGTCPPDAHSDSPKGFSCTGDFKLTNLAPALFGVRVETFAFATMIGILPATFTFATAGAGLDSVIASQKASVEACRASGRTDCAYDLDVWSLLTPQILAAFAALGIMALIPVAVRHWRRRKAAAATP